MIARYRWRASWVALALLAATCSAPGSTLVEREGAQNSPETEVSAFSADLLEASPEQRKQMFIATLLPLIGRANEEIAADRELLLGVKLAIAEGRELDTD